MQDTLLSPHWYRLSGLHPRLCAHVNVRMQRTRGQAWYVLFNQMTGRFHRINAQAFEVVGRLDGRASVDDIWQRLLERDGDKAPTQDDVIRIMGQLTEAGLVQAEVSPDVRQMASTQESRRGREQRSRLNPLSFRLELFNPASLLEWLYPRLSWLMSRWVVWGVLALLSVSLVQSVLQFKEIMAYAEWHFLTPRFLAISWLLYPVMKALHELGHALALRRFACEVPMVGVNFFLFVPMPYVDASAASRLGKAWQRAVISAAGILVELTLAAMGLSLWLVVEDGWVREFAFVLMTLGGLSTLLFNGNPLMKLDGYFVLSDALNVPNLAQRSARIIERSLTHVWAWLLRWHLPGARAPRALMEPVERWALRLYAPLSWLYRWSVCALMVGWAADKAAWLGLGLMVWMGWTLVGRPVWHFWQQCTRQPGFEAVSGRARWVFALLLTAGVGGLAWVPVPDTAVVHGVVWLPEQAQVRAASDGEVRAVIVPHGSRVRAGQPLIVLQDPILQSKRDVVLAQLEGGRAELIAALANDLLKARNAQEALKRDEWLLAQIEKDLAQQVLRAQVDGVFVMARQEDLVDRPVNRGQLLAQVLPDGPSTVRAVVSQSDVDAVRHRLTGASVMLHELPGRVLPAQRGSETPAAVDRLPDAALGAKANGPIATAPDDADGLKPAEPMFVLDVRLQEHLPRAGGLARVRLDLSPEPLLSTWSRRVRQLLLKHFSDVKDAT